MNASSAAYKTFRDVLAHPERGSFAEGSRAEIYDYLFDLYSNQAYEEAAKYARYFTRFKLYHSTRLLYNPMRRLVDFYAAQVYPGTLVMHDDLRKEDDLQDAIPFNSDIDPDLRDAIGQVWMWSNFQGAKNRIVRLGAMTGNVLCSVYDSPERSRVHIAPIWPGFVTDLELSTVGDIRFYAIEYRVLESNGESSYVYRKEVSEDRIATYRDGALYSYNELPAEYDNPYGFVPSVWIKHQDNGTDFGTPAIGGSIGRIDELNSLVSHLHDHFHKQIDLPQIISTDSPISAALKPADAADSGIENRQASRLLRTSAGASVHPLIGNIDPESLEPHLARMVAEIEQEHPELTFWSQLRAMSQVTGPGASRLMGDVQGRVWEAAASYDNGFRKLFQMAVAIGGWRENSGNWAQSNEQTAKFAPFGLDSYSAGDLDFMILPRPIIPITGEEKLNVRGKRINQALSLRDMLPPQQILLEAGYTVEEAQEFIAAMPRPEEDDPNNPDNSQQPRR